MNWRCICLYVVPHVLILLVGSHSVSGSTASDVQTCYNYAVQLNRSLPTYSSNLKLKAESVELGYETIDCLDQVFQQYDTEKHVDPAVARNCTTLIQNSQTTGITYGKSELGVAVQYVQYLLPNIATKIALKNLETEN